MSCAVLSEEPGAPETYSIRDHIPLSPGSGQIGVAVKAIGVSYVDVLIAGWSRRWARRAKPVDGRFPSERISTRSAAALARYPDARNDD